MPTTYTDLIGTTNIEFDPDPGIIPPDSYILKSTIYSSMIERPETVKRTKPKGDSFDMWTSRRLRSSSYTYLMGKSITTHPEGTYRVVSTGPYSHFAGPPTLDDHYDDLSSFDDLDLRMRAKIKNQKVNLLQAFGERKQTAGLLVDLFRGVRSAARELVSSFGVSAFVRWLQGDRSKKSMEIASRWLQYQYGLRPLMSDIFGTAEVLTTNVHRGFPIYVELGQRVQSNFIEVIGIVYNEHSTTTRRRIRVRYTFEDSPQADLTSLGITNPALLLWELTPWSFVADWAINIGEYLGGLDALLGVKDIEVLRSYTKLSLVESISQVTPKPAKAKGWCRVTERFGKTNDLSYGAIRLSNPFAANGVVRSLNALALTRAQFR